LPSTAAMVCSCAGLYRWEAHSGAASGVLQAARHSGLEVRVFVLVEETKQSGQLQTRRRCGKLNAGVIYGNGLFIHQTAAPDSG
jgi:hypothetical protein